MMDWNYGSGHDMYSEKGHHVFLEDTLQGDACMACQKGPGWQRQKMNSVAITCYQAKLQRLFVFFFF
jgi:hypothetical protein